MPDLGAVLDRAAVRVEEALATSGCTVDLRAPVDPAGAAADPVTLAVSGVANAPFAASVPAIVAEKPGSDDGQPARGGKNPAATVVLPPGPVVPLRTEVVVRTCRDAALVGRVYAATLVRRNLAGVVQVVDAERVSG